MSEIGTKLNDTFLQEFLKAALRNNSVFEIGRKYLKYQYLPTEPFKKIWKSAVIYFDLSIPNNPPTLGILAQQHSGDKEVLEILNQIKQSVFPDVKGILTQFELFIKQSKFVELYNNLAEFYNNNEKEKAFKYLQEASEGLNNFTLKDLSFEKIYDGFHDRYGRKKAQFDKDQSTYRDQVPFSIEELDTITGGIGAGDTALFLAQSGVGKTKLLRWIGVGASRRGYKVLHIQLEGTKEEAYSGYDATWSGQKIFALEYGNIDPEMMKKMNKVLTDIRINGGEIYVEAYERFKSASMVDARNSLIEAEKAYSKIDVVLIDYLELIEPGDGRYYKPDEERFRREKIGDMMKNLAVEFKTRVITATQASTVSPEFLRKPDFVMTRYNVSEFKNIIKPFSYFITLNQTPDEYDNNIMRLFGDKFRKVKGNRLITIKTAYDSDRFYDHRATMKMLSENSNKK